MGREIAGDAPIPPPGWLPIGGEVTEFVKEFSTYLRQEMKPNLDIALEMEQYFRPIVWVFRHPNSA